MLQTRMEYGQAEKWNVDEVDAALGKISPLNMSLIENNLTHHDQLALLEELGRYISPQTKALLHPGTTSYDVLDTARAYNLKAAWKEVVRPEAAKTVVGLCNLSTKARNMMQVGRTHLQDTSPVTVDLRMSKYARRIADQIEACDNSFRGLKGKMSGIVGTGAGIEMVVGKGRSMDFEMDVLKKLDLEPDYSATQTTAREPIVRVGNDITLLMLSLGKFAHDTRILYSSAINEITSRDNAERLGGSSADATKNNPIDYENIEATTTIVSSGMNVLYSTVITDLERDLTDSKRLRYQPGLMISETYEAFSRANKKCLPQFSINEDNLGKNLIPVRKNPSEAMTAILKGAKFISSKGVGHDAVKDFGKKAKKENKTLLEIALQDSEFTDVYTTLSQDSKDILNGKLELYLGSALERADKNVKYSIAVANRQF
jgi:adenylosuccinate lyase